MKDESRRKTSKYVDRQKLLEWLSRCSNQFEVAAKKSTATGNSFEALEYEGSKTAYGTVYFLVERGRFAPDDEAEAREVGGE